jgi:ribosomal protein L11 methyltransferase
MLNGAVGLAANFDASMTDTQKHGGNVVPHVVLSIAETQVELAADFLMQLGARAVEERSVGQTVELWAVVGDAEASERCLVRCSGEWAGRVEWVSIALSDAWKEFAQAVEVNPHLMITPSWHQIDHDHGNAIAVLIDPEESFGLGDHPTTRLVADMLWRHVRPGMSVLDMGSGSGVLSIVAALRGATRVLGIDRSSGAVTVSERNAARNLVSELTEFRHGSVVPSGEMFDLVAANILAPVLLELSDSIVQAVEPEGLIILSGLHVDRSSHVVERYRTLGCHVVEEVTLEGWYSALMKRMR